MQRQSGFKNIRTRLTVWLFLTAMLPLSIACVIIYFQRVESIKATEFDKLSVIRNLKVKILQDWIDERTSDTKNLSEKADARKLEFLRLKKRPSDQEMVSLEHVRDALKTQLLYYPAYSELFLIDSFGKIIVSTKEKNQGLNKRQFPYFNEPMLTGNIHIQDIYHSKELHKNAMTFSSPIFCSDHNREHIIGVIVLRIDLESSLYPLLLDRSGLGQTGETLIVNKQVYALNELLWHKNAPLKLKIMAKPAAMAANGETGVAETNDYRGEPVLAAYTYIPDTGWGFVSKQDQKEIYARINILLTNLIIILILSMIASYFLAYMLAKGISTPLLDVTSAALRIEEGDLNARVTTKTDDEYRILARAFNGMAESLTIQNNIQKNIGGVNKILMTETKIENVSKKIIEKLIDCTDSAFGVFCLLNEEKYIFEPLFSIGFHMSNLEKMDPEIIIGAFNRSLETKEITYLDEIPSDTFFTVCTIAGTAIPQSIVTIPVLVKEKVIGVISLGNLNQYSNESKELINRIHTGLNTGVSNILSGEELQNMALDLNDKNAELEGQAAELMATSEELKQQNKELVFQRKKVEEANKLKSEFLSNMSHELRTPLNSVLALSNVLRMQAVQKLNSEELEYLSIIERNSRQLLTLINDILDLSKIEAGRMDITVDIFPPKVTIENILDSIQPLCQEKSLLLDVNLPSDLPQIKSDERKIHHILENLLSNAIKFTETGAISVSARFDGQNLYVEVSDTGIGISKHDLPNIFDEFKQVDGSTTRRYEGTGLGLAITHKAAKLLGGELTVTSRPGAGSTFILTLPLIWESSFSLSKNLEEPEVDQESKRPVLVVDDDPVILNMISGFLTDEGFRVLTVSSGESALQVAEKAMPFAITLDLMMPDMDGFEVLQQLKANPKTAHIHVIIVSVLKDKDTGFAMGAVGYLSKPVKKTNLINEINRLCNKPFSVLVVDDNRIERETIIEIIEKEDITTLSASNGKECMDLLKKSRPDIIILDLMMPEMDGFEVLEKLRSDPSTICLPVIIVTAKDLTEEERNRLSRHVVYILNKNNLSKDKLLIEIKKYLRKIEKNIPDYILNAKKERILVVEDNESSIIQIQKILEKEGYIVDVAKSGQEAVDFVASKIPDGIIMDLMMPGVDGFEVLEIIRRSKDTEAIPVLVLTAKDLTPDDLSRLSANHISQLIQKGDVKREDILAKVTMMLTHSNPKGKEQVLPISKIQVKPGEKPKILVIEDNPDNMITVKAILKKDYTVFEAINGEQGLKLAARNLPDMILLDISLSGMDGYEIIKKLKTDKRLQHIPVIALTAHAMLKDQEKIIQEGFNDIITKPIIPAKMLERLRHLFNG